MSEHFSVAEIRDLCMGEPSDERVPDALAAFNGFADLFGRGWIEQFFSAGRDNFRAHYIASLWHDWLLVHDLPGADKLRKRWWRGPYFEGVGTEVRVLARLAALAKGLELFPDCGSSEPDFRLPVTDAWLYGEITHRHRSQVAKRWSETMGRLSRAVTNCVPLGKHGQLAILREIDDREIEVLEADLAANAPIGERRIADMAVFRVVEADGIAGSTWISAMAPSAQSFVTMIERNPEGLIRQATIGIGITDRGAQTLLESEASQLPTDAPGVVIIHTSGVVGGYAAWVSLIRRRFQPTLNRRISGVVLVQTDYGRPRLPGDGALLINPHARYPLPADTLPIFEGLLRKEE